jgi:glycosyltransferase involved in cell wall biosynthesis
MSNRRRTRALFLTRKFPPSVGGMETLAEATWRALSAAAPDSVLVAHSGRNRTLALWLPRAMARTLWLATTRRVDVVVTGDAPMCALASPFLRVLGVPCVTMALGLDLTYRNRLYRAIVHPTLRRASTVIAISEATARVARELGVDPAKVHVLRLAVAAPEVSPDQRRKQRARLNARLGTTDDHVLLLTLGRLVRRKGTDWFLRNVLPALPPHVILVVAGSGRDEERIAGSVADLGLTDRVRLLGSVDEDERELLLQGADLFVQPNIRVPGDMEGFGLVTVEAALRGLPVVAADLEGISDAVLDGVTGILLRSGDASAWIDALSGLAVEREVLAETGHRFQAATRQRYSERAMADRLVELVGLERTAA